MGRETRNLVAETLGRDDSDFIADLLVDLEVKSETGVVLLDDDSRSLLDSLCSYATLL